MKQRLLVAGSCLFAVAAFAAGCGGSDSGGDSGNDQGGTPAASDEGGHKGGTLTMLWSAPGQSIDTAIAYDANWQVLRMTGDALLGWKQVEGTAGNELVPDLAEAIPEPTDGGKTYAFTMREGIKFSTGETVKPSDIRYTIERNFKAAGPGSGFYASIVGADACAKKPKTCDLSEGIVADDAANTVTFKLTAPDPDMLQKLAMPFAFAVPKGTPNKDIGTDPLPATGPYMITKYDPDSEMVFERNPEFKEWSAEAQPAGNPDKIVMKVGLPLEDATTQIQNGDADWMYDIPPADRLGEISTEFESQVHVNPGPQVFHMALNTRVAPFDNKDVRQALNFATDRDARDQDLRRPGAGHARRARACRRTSPAISPTARTRRTRARSGPRPTWPRPSSSSTPRARRARRSRSSRRTTRRRRPSTSTSSRCCASSATTPASRA